MTRALLLSAGSSWAAYEMGALEHLISARGKTFDLYVGAGIGAMNAAFAACGKVDELGRFWDRAGIRSLVSVDFRRLFSSPLSNRPQREFVDRHISEKLLQDKGVQLAVTTLDLCLGLEVVLRYPGCELPLVDGIMAAVATSGLLPPVPFDDKLLAEATLVESVPMVAVAHLGPGDEITAILPALPDGSKGRRSYKTWRSVLERALAMNLANDVRCAVRNHREDEKFASEVRQVIDGIDEILEGIGDPTLATSLRQRAHAEFSTCSAESAPQLTAIIPSSELGYPLWRFRRKELAAARAMGFHDAEVLVP
jgi:predicted acylesterase/phospholipase RssA